MLHMTKMKMKMRTRAGGANTPKRGARRAEQAQGPMATEDTMLTAAPPFATEALVQVKIAVPVGVNMVASTVRDFITLAFLGRLGQSSSSVELAAAALAGTLMNMTGKSIIVGLSTAVNTLAGQAYGAGSYARVGFVAQRGVVILTTATMLLSSIWWHAEAVLLMLYQDGDVAFAAGSYTRGLIPGMFAFAWNLCAQAYLQSQAITGPQAAAGIAATILHGPINYLLVYHFNMQALGVALATSVSTGIVLAVNSAYIFILRYSPALREECEILAHKRDACAPAWSRDELFCVNGAREFLELGLPGVFMMLEWWASELSILLAGLLPSPAVAVAAMSIYQTTGSLSYDMAHGFAQAALTRVSHELGAGAADKAKHAAFVATTLILTASLLVSFMIYSFRAEWPTLFTCWDSVNALASKLLAVLAVYVVFDSLGCTCTGVLRACAMQKVGAQVVIFSYYVIGIPISLFLAFHNEMGPEGLVLGSLIGTIVHGALYVALIFRFDWVAQSESAMARSQMHVNRSAAAAGDVDEKSSPTPAYGATV